MKTGIKIAIVAGLGVVVVGVLALKNQNKDRPVPVPDAQVDAMTAEAATPAAVPETLAARAEGPLPKLLDLGAGKCIPCKMMAPILEELKQEYAGRMDVEFVDVWENREAAKAFGIEAIPTQIFFDASGEERFRHTGFYGKEDILATWQELGVDLDSDGSETDGME
jgi:thioredoxin 1